MHYSNPYYDNDFFDFFVTLVHRVMAFVNPGAEPLSLVQDELQILVLLCISLSSALVGVWLILRKMGMLANALSHTILPGIVLAFLTYHWAGGGSDGYDFSYALPSEWLLIGSSLVMALITTLLTEALVRLLHLPEDASCGIVFTFLFAVGVILVTTLTRSAHIGSELLMGNVDALQPEDLAFVVKIALVNGIMVLALHRGFLATTFDPIFSRVGGISAALFGYLLMVQVAVTAIGAFRAVGVLMFTAFLVMPPLTARLWTERLRALMLLAMLVAGASSVLAVACSRHLFSVYAWPVSTAGLVVVWLSLLYGATLLFSPQRGIVTAAIRKRWHMQSFRDEKILTVQVEGAL